MFGSIHRKFVADNERKGMRAAFPWNIYKENIEQLERVSHPAVLLLVQHTRCIYRLYDCSACQSNHTTGENRPFSYQMLVVVVDRVNGKPSV